MENSRHVLRSANLRIFLKIRRFHLLEQLYNGKSIFAAQRFVGLAQYAPVQHHSGGGLIFDSIVKIHSRPSAHKFGNSILVSNAGRGSESSAKSHGSPRRGGCRSCPDLAADPRLDSRCNRSIFEKRRRRSWAMSAVKGSVHTVVNRVGRCGMRCDRLES